MMTDAPADPLLTVDVLVVGAGLAGLPLAIALAQAGIAVAIVDRAAPDRMRDGAFDGRTTALSYGSQQILHAIGLWEALAPFAQPMVDIRVADKGSSLFVHYDHRDLPAPYQGAPFGWIIENFILRRHLIAAAEAIDTRGSAVGLDGQADGRTGRRAGGLHYIAPATLTTLTHTPHRVLAGFQDGRQISARLVVAADGKHSEVRTLTGIETHGWSYDQSAIICTIGHGVPHHGVAVEHFFPTGPFAILPLTENRASIVWSEDRDRAPALLALDDARFLAAVQAKVGDWLGPLHLIGPRYAHPLEVRHADRTIGPRLALVGEAAHVLHPIAGQGLNLGLRDVAALAELIVDHARLGLDIGSDQVLARYARWRRTDTVSLTLITDGLTRLFSNDIAPVKHARGLGLALINHLPPVKRLLMRHAMGVVGTLPRMVEGRTL